MPKHQTRFDGLEASPKDIAVVEEILSAGGLSEDMRADEGPIAALELAYVKSEVYREEYPNLTGRRLVPEDNSAPEWAEYVVTRVFDRVGYAKLISNYSDDIPMADVVRRSYATEVRDLASAYGFTYGELRAAGNPNAPVNLETEKAMAARESIENAQNRLIFKGDPKANLFGLLSHPNIAVTAITGNWATQTDAQVLYDDLQKLYDSIFMGSWGVHRPNTLAVDPVSARVLTTTRFPGMVDRVSAWDLFSKDHPGIQMEVAFELMNSDPVNGKSTAIMYERRPDVLSYSVPMPFKQLPPQRDNLKLKTICLSRIGGVQITRPMAITKAYTN